MGIHMSTGYCSTPFISHVHLFCILCILSFGDGRILSLKQNFERPVIIYNRDGSSAYKLQFYDNGTDCRRSFHIRHKSVFAAHKHTVKTVLDVDGSAIINMTWDVAELPRSPYRQHFQFKAKFEPFYEVVDATKKCILMVAKTVDPSPMESHLFYFDWLQIPPGKKGALEITPSDSGHSETMDINSECQCMDQSANVLDLTCLRITLAFYKHPHISYFNFTIHRMNNTGASFTLKGQAHLGKNQSSFISDEYYLSKPGLYSVKMQFSCSTGNTTRTCREPNFTKYISPCSPEPGFEADGQPGHEKTQWVVIAVVCLIIILVTFIAVTCWCINKAGTQGVGIQRQNNRIPVNYDVATSDVKHEEDHLVVSKHIEDHS